VESYRSEEEQLEALKRWWEENGRTTVIAIVLALVGAFGWQGWQEHRQGQREEASSVYQALLQAADSAEQSATARAEFQRLAARLKNDFGGTTYAQFAGLQAARLAVSEGDLAAAADELRWVLAEADSGSDLTHVARQRLARVVAASGDDEGALAMLETTGDEPYQASYALARGDILLAAGRETEALTAYQLARQLGEQLPGQVNLATLAQKIASLTAVAPRPAEPVTAADASGAQAGEP
jgi:predicted negative regulator of RcsB-dependent stress response